jgi:PD-(D/E)XK nuclease superfamily
MTTVNLAKELQAISGELEKIRAIERAAAIKLDRRFAEDQEAIEKLLRSVQEAKLGGRWRNTRFNIFDVLGLEEAHSSFLAWVLDPMEAHGFRDAFLRKFMRKAVGNEPHSTLDVSVSREYRCAGMRFDVHVKGVGWCLVVENKVDDSPGDDQCKRYQEYCRMLTERGERAWLVYVTRPARRPPRAIRWLSYRDVRQILQELTPDASAATAIDHFCAHITSDLEV